MNADAARGWVLVTGCSSGIGRALVAELRAQGWGVVATARRLDSLAGLPPGEDLRALALDITDASSLEAAVAACAHLRLIALVNNAGYAQVGPLEYLTAEELRRQFETNVVGLHAATHAFIPLIRKNAKPREGRIVQVASMLGRLSIPLGGPYNASKHAVVALAETLRYEIGDEIPVMLVEPGAIRTEFRETLTKVWGDLPVRVKGTRYEAILARYLASGKDRSQRWGGDAAACARRIARAMSRRRPPRRLRIGLDSNLASKVKAILPAAVWEWALRKAYGLR
ncbi:MAG TPA: SDR family NAD(P)-dependent oxidoreductase [Holophagaceae bacterium]|nr:SDR family NAD(P)-dependent oxidoreductase [Holophagaceae bacterium]